MQNIFLLILIIDLAAGLDFSYHGNVEMKNFLQDTANKYPNLTHLYSVGKTVDNEDLWVIAIGNQPNNHVSLRPHVKYIGNMHGNEMVSRELLLHLVEYFVTSYTTNTTISKFLNETVVHIMPSMNPDGFTIATVGDCTGIVGRANKNGYDLNRNFPDYFQVNTAPIQPETAAVMNWTRLHPFVLSANLHGGTLVVNYPFDNYPNAMFARYAASPDDDVFIALSKSYSFAHGNMYLGKHCGDVFQDGITNGAMWYPVTGGMQDWNYIQAGCMETTMEISCCKYPPNDTLPQFWLDNQNALVSYLMQVHTGVKGLILDLEGNPVAMATLKIRGRDLVSFRSTKYGEYWRILLPGTYTIQVISNLNVTERTFTVQDSGVTRLDIRVWEGDINTASIASHSPLIVISWLISSICVLLL